VRRFNAAFFGGEKSGVKTPHSKTPHSGVRRFLGAKKSGVETPHSKTGEKTWTATSSSNGS
jgi:hypothetical protein